MSDEWLCPHCKRLPGNHAAWCEIGMKNQPRPTISEEKFRSALLNIRHYRLDEHAEQELRGLLREAGVTVEGKP